ncbi:MAG: hypothetical protein IH987_10590, partial [Planctomycetes bacterium]|nr:hypothetical protein [Planctomycetota bacterium]
ENWEDYYRLAHIEDRNGNRLQYVYDSSDPTNRLSFLVAEIYEAAYPERKLQFSYNLGSGLNGVDRGDRLNTVTDPMGRETTYSFGLSGGQAWDLLLEVKREEVPDAENGDIPAQPTVTFAYHAVELPTEDTESPPSLPPTDETTKNRYVGPSLIIDARGHETTFSYITDFFPSTFNLQGQTFYQQKIRLTGASTIDGPVVLTQETRTPERVITRSKDTRDNTAKYDFVAQRLPADNEFGVAIYVTQLTRTSEALKSQNEAVFQWTADAFANLFHVTDMNGNMIDYTYGDLASQQSNQPTQRTITDIGSGETITTNYEYGAFSKMTRLVDGESKEMNFIFDPNGNRTEVREELGKTTLYQYASDGFVDQVTDPDGRVTIFTRSFDDADLNIYYTLISSVTGYPGEMLELDTETVNDVMGNKVRMTDPEENVYTQVYDALYRRTRTTNPAVEESPGGPLVTSTIEYKYNLNGSVIEETDDLGNVTVSVFDPMNRVTKSRRRMTDPAINDDAEDLITTNNYNPVGLVETITDPNGNVTEFEYDALLRLCKKTFDALDLGYAETFEYDNNAGSGAFMYTTGWKPTRSINRRGYARDTVYDGFYRPVTSISRQTDGEGVAHDDLPATNEPATMTSYNKVHNVLTTKELAESDAGGDRKTVMFYDDLRRPTISLLDFDGDGNDGDVYTPEITYVNDAAAFIDHDAEDFISRSVYDLAGNAIQSIDAENNRTDTIYDGAGRPTTVKQAAVEFGDPPQSVRPTTITVYDNNSNVTGVTDANENQTKMVYDARNHLTRTIHDLDGDQVFDPIRPGPDVVIDTHLDLGGNVVQTIDANGNISNMDSDRAYRVIEVRGPPVADAENGGQLRRPATRSEYDRNSNVLKVIDPRGVQTVSEYDGLNRVLSTTNAFDTFDAVTTSSYYDQNNNVIAFTLDNGAAGLQTTEFLFDPIDRQVREIWPGGNLTTKQYFRNSLVQASIDPKGQTIESDYDRANRVITSVSRRANDSIEETRTFTYDRMDNLLSATNCRGGDASIESPQPAGPPHNILKNRYISINPGNPSLAAFDIRLTLTDTLVNTVAIGQIGSVWWADVPNANCISIVGRNRPTEPPNWSACDTVHLTGCPIIPTSTYDIVTIDDGSVSDPPLVAQTQALPGGGKWWGDAVGTFNGTEWTAPQGTANIDDAVAAIKTFQDPNACNATHVSVTDLHPITNDSNNQINKLVNFNDVLQFIKGFQGEEYNGNLIADCPVSVGEIEKGACGTTEFTYDAIYRVVAEYRTDAGETPYTVTSAYDLNSNRISVIYPQTDRTLTSEFDRLNRLTHVVDSVDAKITTYDYDVNSNIVNCTKPNGVIDWFAFDALNRVTSHLATAGGPDDIYNAAYTYDLSNQRRTIDEAVQGHDPRSLVYGYDEQYRLTSEDWAGQTYAYTYDPAGNRQTKTINGVTTDYTYNHRNEMLTETTDVNTINYVYDLNGNRIQKDVFDGAVTDYVWDVNDRLVKADANGATVFQASYDYRTRRLSKTEGGNTTYFRYDAGVSFQELESGTTSINVEFVRGSGMGGGIGSILYSDRSVAGGTDEFFCSNAVGHTVALADSDGFVVKSDLYEAFGNIVSSFGASSNNRLANTKERDALIGLDNHGFRYYDPANGRYVTRDSIGYLDGLNVYLYVHSNPVNKYDPLGLFSWDDLWEGVSDAFDDVWTVGEQLLYMVLNAIKEDPSEPRFEVGVRNDFLSGDDNDTHNSFWKYSNGTWSYLLQYKLFTPAAGINAHYFSHTELSATKTGDLGSGYSYFLTGGLGMTGKEGEFVQNSVHRLIGAKPRVWDPVLPRQFTYKLGGGILDTYEFDNTKLFYGVDMEFSSFMTSANAKAGFTTQFSSGLSLTGQFDIKRQFGSDLFPRDSIRKTVKSITGELSYGRFSIRSTYTDVPLRPFPERQLQTEVRFNILNFDF